MFESLISYVQQHPEECIILGLLLLSELLGSLPQFKSNSIFQLLITILRGMLSKTSFGALMPPDSSTVTVVEESTLTKESLIVSKPLLDKEKVETKDPTAPSKEPKV